MLSEVSPDDLCTEKKAVEACKGLLRADEYEALNLRISKAKKAVEARTAWRVEGTAERVPKFPPINLWLIIRSTGMMKQAF